jgi:hypothetical protein
MAQFLGFLFFLIMATAGFWGVMFFAAVLVPWIIGWLNMKAKEKKGKLVLEERKILPKQDGITLLYQKN